MKPLGNSFAKSRFAASRHLLLSPLCWDRFCPLGTPVTPCFSLMSLDSLNNDDVCVSASVFLSWSGALEDRQHAMFSITPPASTVGMDKWLAVLGPFEILQTSL